MISDHQLKLLSLQICRQGVSIVEALSWNAFQMEGEVNDDMVDVIVQRRALFGQAYVQLRQAYPLLPEQLRDFQLSFTPAHLCPEKKILCKIFIGPRCPWGPIYGSGCLSLTDVFET